MEQAATTSPFSSLSKQEQREKWHAWQSTHFQSTELPDTPAFAKEPLPPLKIPKQPEEPRYIPRRAQYDQVMNRLKKAHENAKFVDS
jgi:hypothetical protein